MCFFSKRNLYYESIKRELKTRPVNECRCDERLKVKLRNLHVSHTLGCAIKEWEMVRKKVTGVIGG
jgi:hypothetical protein